MNQAEKMDGDRPEAYFIKFEQVMLECHIGQEDWPFRLIALFTGKALDVTGLYQTHKTCHTGKLKKEC